MTEELIGPKQIEYSIKIARNKQEVEEMRGPWEHWQSHPNVDFNFYFTIVDSRSEIVRPHVLLISANGAPKGMLVGRIEDRELVTKFGYLRLFRPRLRILRIVYGGLLGDQCSHISQIYVSELLKELEGEEVELVIFDLLHVDSYLYQLAKSKPGFLCRDHRNFQNAHWRMILPAKYEELLSQMKLNPRYQLNRLERYDRSLKRDYGEKVEFRICKSINEVDKFCRNADRIMKNTYQRGLGVGFNDNNENRRRLNLQASKGQLRGYELYVADVAVAFWIGSTCGNVYYLDFTGYDTDFKKYDPGMVLLLWLLEDCCKNGIRQIDFGFGDAFYKGRFGSQKWEEASVYIFAPTIKGIGINLIITLIAAMDKHVESILDKANLFGRVKRIWRSRLARNVD